MSLGMLLCARLTLRERGPETTGVSVYLGKRAGMLKQLVVAVTYRSVGEDQTGWYEERERDHLSVTYDFN